jgi:hypothetical protein
MNNIFLNVSLDGMDFEVKWHDFGSYYKMDVLQNSKLLGSKKFPITTDRGDGVVKHTIRSFLKDKSNGKDTIH